MSWDKNARIQRSVRREQRGHRLSKETAMWTILMYISSIQFVGFAQNALDGSNMDDVMQTKLRNKQKIFETFNFCII